MLEAEDAHTPWQRVLWLKQPGFPDNHLDDSFLENLQRNVNVRKYTYRGLCYDTLPVTQHICSIAVFVAIFTHLYEGNLEYRLVSALSAAAFFGAHTLSKSLSDCGRSSLLSIPSALTLSVILLLLSPILQTLSKATTSDSIWPLAGALLFVNAILADYSASEASTTGTPSSLSLNAAICASAVLSSRLSEQLNVFALMLFSVQCFALLPLLRAQIQRKASSTLHIGITVLLACTALVLFLPLSLPVAGMYCISITGLQFAIPLWLLRLQSLKNELRGPWDAAVPKLSM